MPRTAAIFAAIFAIISLVTASPARPAQATGVEREILVPAGWEGAYDFGYAPVIRVGDRVIVSGIPAGGDGTYEEKIRGMYRRAVELLTAAVRDAALPAPRRGVDLLHF